mgnify:FL=1
MGRRKISIFGSTGSIGCNTVKLLLQQGGSSNYNVQVLTGGKNVKVLADQAIKLKAKMAVTAHDEKLNELRFYLKDSEINVAAGKKALIDSSHIKSDWTMSAIIGAAGIEVGLNSAKHGGVLALANKETLVCAGNLLKEIALKNSTIIIPVDSEHSAIFQCLRGEKEDAIESITLTASGGPFRDWPLEKLKYVEAGDAAKHPNWSMGKKISIDSASMFNKGLEVIEASSLFALSKDKIKVLIHPQSIVHGFIGFKDGASIAQMSSPDMLTAIGFSLNYPNRPYVKVDRMNLGKIHNLNFEEIDFNRWPALGLAYDVIDLKSTSATVYNAAKEEASEAFIEGKIGFLDMFTCVDYVIDYLIKKDYFATNYCGLAEIFESDSLSRKITRKYIAESNF